MTILLKVKAIFAIVLLLGLGNAVYVAINEPAQNAETGSTLKTETTMAEGSQSPLTPLLQRGEQKKSFLENALSPPNGPAIGDIKPNTLLDTWTADDSPAANGCVPIRKKPCN